VILSRETINNERVGGLSVGGEGKKSAFAGEEYLMAGEIYYKQHI